MSLLWSLELSMNALWKSKIHKHKTAQITYILHNIYMQRKYRKETGEETPEGENLALMVLFVT